MDKEFEQFKKEQVEAVNAIREAWEKVEEGIFTKGEAKELEEKANKKYEDLEKQIKEGLKNLESYNDRLDDFEARMKRPGNVPGGGEEESAEKKTFEKFLRFGTGVLDGEEVKSLKSVSTTQLSPEILAKFGISEEKSQAISGTTGVAYLAPGEYANEIIKGVVEISPMRTIADVKTTTNNFVEIPKRTGEFAATWVAEEGTRSETTGLTYGMERIPNHEMYALVKVSRHALEDSAFNLESELTMEFAEQFGKAEGTAFVTGDGVGKPEGFTVNSDVTATTVVHDASDAAMIIDGVIDLLYLPKTAYQTNAKIVCRRATMALLRKAKDSNNKYYWEPSFQAGQPGLFMGYPLIELPDMAACADGAKCLGFGDFKKAYVISDRVQIEVQRLVELYAASGQVGFLARKRVGGQVVLAEAIDIGIGQA